MPINGRWREFPFLISRALHRPLRDDLRAAAARVLASGRFILGPEVAAFERELAGELGVAEAVGVSSGTDALTALLMAAGVGPGDEVVTTPYSFFATVESIVRLGARPVFADIEPGTMNLDAAEAALGSGSAPKRSWWSTSSGARLAQAPFAPPALPAKSRCSRTRPRRSARRGWARVGGGALVLSVEEPGRLRRRRRDGDE